MKNTLILIFDILLMFLILFFSPIDSLQIKEGLSILIFISILWLTEALPLPVSALFVPILAVLFGILDVKEAFKSFAHPIIFLFLGGFALASALRKYELDKYIAYKIVGFSKGNFKVASFLIMLTTAFLSMWMSNTSATVIMLPLAIGLLGYVDKDKNNTYPFLLLGIAYSASIGGIGSIIGSPPNAITASLLNMGFFDWFKIGFPIALILLPIVYAVLYLYFKPQNQNIKLESNFKIENRKCVLVGIVFLFVVLLWMMSEELSALFGVEKYFDSIVAVFGVILLFSLGLINWDDLNKSVDWGVLLLFGGALSLSYILSTTGTSEFISYFVIDALNGIPTYLYIFGLVLFSILITNIMSNTGVASVLIPILITTALQLNLKPEVIALPIGISVSCAFILPVATPPNALVFGSGYIKEKDMIRAGFILSLISAIVVSLMFTF
ncbi:SLC13 family permease [Methanotorris formicicus]|uniref:Anion transporter n=1 Tax=Methanotorris formicicus Mc-S-70 TaxID=647171 RepID=H1KYJ5_9EURY|nr:DASS family sodium-coupled anion symporter [Methanotorris formicicus]EHP87035.1 anion transporter [Methanotorris formicicus Mc-S-70]